MQKIFNNQSNKLNFNNKQKKLICKINLKIMCNSKKNNTIKNLVKIIHKDKMI